MVSLTVKDLVAFMEAMAPLSLAENWDNVGLQVGDLNQQVTGVLVTLDVNLEVIQEAVTKGNNLIIAHHPLLFKPLGNLRKDNVQGKIIFSLIEHGISLYVAHTNLDSAPVGVNQVLAQQLGLQNIEILAERSIASIQEDVVSELSSFQGNSGLGRIGNLPQPMLFADFAQTVKQVLGGQVLNVGGDLNRQVHRIAVCGGSGTSLATLAVKKGAQVLVTGDVKYHEAQGMVDTGLNYIDAGHYETEQVILPELVGYLDQLVQVPVHLSEAEVNPRKQI